MTSQEYEEELRQGEAIFSFPIEDCSIFFPIAIKLFALGIIDTRKFVFRITITESAEISILQYLAVFCGISYDSRYKDVEGIVDEVIFETDVNDEKSNNKLYFKISQFLYLISINPRYRQVDLKFKSPSIKSPSNSKKLISYDNYYKMMGFGDTGLPLVPFGSDVYYFFQENSKEFIESGDNGEPSGYGKDYDEYALNRRAIIREICKGFDEKFKKQKSLTPKNKNKLEEVDVLSYLLLGAAFDSIYHSQDGSSTTKSRKKIFEDDQEFVSFYENCQAYSSGIIQLLENSIRYTRGGFLALRVLRGGNSEGKKGELGLDKYLQDKKSVDTNFLLLSICDVSEDSYHDIVEVFQENLNNRLHDSSAPLTPKTKAHIEELLEAPISINELFYPMKNSKVLNYLESPNSIGYHYGLQIFVSSVEGVQGNFLVSSANPTGTTKKFNLATNAYNEAGEKFEFEYEKTNELIPDYYCGTRYEILLPVSNVTSNVTKKTRTTGRAEVPKNLSFEAFPEISPIDISIKVERLYEAASAISKNLYKFRQNVKAVKEILNLKKLRSTNLRKKY